MAEYLDKEGLLRYNNKIVEKIETSDEVLSNRVSTLDQSINTKVDGIKSDIDSTIEDLESKVDANYSTLDSKITDLSDTVEDLDSTVEQTYIKKEAENQTIDGALTITGNLTVQGTTTTVEQETLAVQSSVIVTNSNKTDLGGNPTGLAMNLGDTSDTTYGLMLDSINKRIVIGEGSLSDDGTFEFSTNQAQNVATIDSDNLQSGDMPVWDRDNFTLKKANIQSGEGENSIQQTESTSKVDTDNENYSYSLPKIVVGNEQKEFFEVYTKAGAYGKDSIELNGRNIAVGDLSTAEGSSTIALGIRTHTEGTKTVAAGANAHAEGLQTAASGDHSHAEGHQTIASEFAAHTEGSGTKATNNVAHAEGYLTEANGYASHSEGTRTKAKGDNSHTEGEDTIAESFASHAEGISTKAGSATRGWIGVATTANISKTISTTGTIENVNAICDNGYEIEAKIEVATDSDEKTIKAVITPAPTETNKVLFQIKYSISGVQPGPTPEPVDAPDNVCVHTEGFATQAYLFGAHAENVNTLALGKGSHAEGFNTEAFGSFSHAGGQNAVARGVGSFSHGYNTSADGNESVAMGIGAEASEDGQVALGRWNANKKGVFEIGAGKSNIERYTALWVDDDGRVHTSLNAVEDEEVVRYGQLVDYAKLSDLASYAKTTDLMRYSTVALTSEYGSDVVQYKANCTTTGAAQIAMGYNSHAIGELAVAIGVNCYARNKRNIAIGNNLDIDNAIQGSTAVGKFNKDKAGLVFQVGNGSFGNLSNGFEVYENGRVAGGRSTQVTDDGKTLVTKDYVDSHSGGGGNPLYLHELDFMGVYRLAFVNANANPYPTYAEAMTAFISGHLQVCSHTMYGAGWKNVDWEYSDEFYMGEFQLKLDNHSMTADEFWGDAVTKL